MSAENFTGVATRNVAADDAKKQVGELLRLVGLSEREWMIYRERFGCLTSYEFLQERLSDSNVHHALARSF
jgi:hypothetical protein